MIDATIKLDLEKELANIGLGPKMEVEHFMANELLRMCDPYVPFDEAGLYDTPGRLRDSGHIEFYNEVVWSTPYARRLYYHPEYMYQGAPMRGAFWADRMLQNGGMDKILTGAKEMCRRLSND